MCRRQLVLENLGQLGEFFALQLGRHLDVPLRHAVQNVGNHDRVRAPQLHRQEVAVQIHPHVQLLAESQRSVARRREGELHGMAGGERARRGEPVKAQTPPDGIADAPPIELHAVVRRECVRPAVVADAQFVIARAEHVTHTEPGEARAVGRSFHRDIQPEIPDDLIQHDVRPHQLDPVIGIEQGALPDRTPRV